MKSGRHEVLRELAGWAPQGAPAEEMRGYVMESAGRIAATAAEIERWPTASRVLEIGGNPHFLTVFMRERRSDLDWSCTNWFGGAVPGGSQTMVHGPTGRRIELPWTSNNIERSPLPFEPEHFDGVVYCEVIEHLYEDPAASLQNIHRVLKPGGTLILTTPNPARLHNVIRLVARLSISDPISGYGPYGRHNREYSALELSELLDGVGFEVVRRSTIHSGSDRWQGRLAARVGYGEYHLFVARRRPGAARVFRPDWLYRSFHS